MKRKKTLPPWTPFARAYYPKEHNDQLVAMGMQQDDREAWRNSRYQVDLQFFVHPQLGRMVEIGIKDHERTARHDWRDLQRIKNELVGEQYDAVEVYPAEDKLVDTANQYYLWAFLETRLPFGFQGRLVAEGNHLKGRQRPWPPGERPADCLTRAEWQEKADAVIRAKQAQQESTDGGSETVG